MGTPKYDVGIEPLSSLIRMAEMRNGRNTSEKGNSCETLRRLADLKETSYKDADWIKLPTIGLLGRRLKTR